MMIYIPFFIDGKKLTPKKRSLNTSKREKILLSLARQKKWAQKNLIFSTTFFEWNVELKPLFETQIKCWYFCIQIIFRVFQSATFSAYF